MQNFCNLKKEAAFMLQEVKVFNRTCCYVTSAFYSLGTDYSTLLHQITTGRGKDIPIYQTTQQHIPEVHSFKCQKKLYAWPLPTRQDGAPHWLQILTGRSTMIGSPLFSIPSEDDGRCCNQNGIHVLQPETMGNTQNFSHG